MHTNRFNIVIVGDAGVGKSTFVNRHLTGEFIRKYAPTVGAERPLMEFNTNHGKIVFDIWDTAGNDVFAGDRENYYKDADAAILMFDVSSKKSYANLQKWYVPIENQRPNIPIIVVGSKCDCNVTDREVKIRMMGFHRMYDLAYFEISSKSNHHLFEPFLWIARKLTGLSTLEFVA